MKIHEYDFNELWDELVGDCIGEGAYRKVYELRHSKDKIIKVEQNVGAFHNVREWTLWHEARWIPGVSEWLAPCVSISKNGNYLIQRKTTPVALEDMPATCPRFLTDRKIQNFGWYNGKIVAHDYALMNIEFGKRQVKGQWWDGNENKYHTS